MDCCVATGACGVCSFPGSACAPVFPYRANHHRAREDQTHCPVYALYFVPVSFSGQCNPDSNPYELLRCSHGRLALEGQRRCLKVPPHLHLYANIHPVSAAGRRRRSAICESPRSFAGDTNPSDSARADRCGGMRAPSGWSEGTQTTPPAIRRLQLIPLRNTRCHRRARSACTDSPAAPSPESFCTPQPTSLHWQRPAASTCSDRRLRRVIPASQTKTGKGAMSRDGSASSANP